MLEIGIEQARQELNVLTVQHDRLHSLIEQAENFFSLSEKPELSDMERLRLTVCRQSVQNNGIHTRADLDCLKTMLQNTDKKLVALKENFKSYQQMYDVYFDIAKTYYAISSGDYISRLVAEKRKR